jgi:hypothetical protein
MNIECSQSKYMYIKAPFYLAIALAFGLSFQSAAHSIPTQWERVEVSLAELLNSGWQLLGTSSNRAAYQNSFSPGGFDETMFVYSLMKNGKHITCYLSDPKPPVAQIAGCRKIN